VRIRIALEIVSVGPTLFLTFVIHEQVGKLLLQCRNFRQVADLNVVVRRVLYGEVLVVLLRVVKFPEQRYFRDDAPGKNFCRIELRDERAALRGFCKAE
jgi:hypothetical protein